MRVNRAASGSRRDPDDLATFRSKFVRYVGGVFRNHFLGLPFGDVIDFLPYLFRFFPNFFTIERAFFLGVIGIFE